MENTTDPSDESRSKAESSDGILPKNETLKALGVLSGFDDASLSHLAPYGRYDRFSADSVIMREGGLQNRFYIIVVGRLQISVRGGGADVHLCEAEPGECVGEVNLLEPGPASATVRAIEPSLLWSMDNVDLRRYLTEHSGGCGSLLIGMASCLSRRLRKANELIRQHYKVPVEVLPKNSTRAITATNAPVPIGFFDQLKKSLVGEKKVQISPEIKL